MMSVLRFMLAWLLLKLRVPPRLFKNYPLKKHTSISGCLILKNMSKRLGQEHHTDVILWMVIR